MRPFLLLLLILPICSLFGSCLAVAENSVPPITFSVTPDSAFVGDRIHCIVSILHSEKEVAAVEWPKEDNASTERLFELVGTKRLVPVALPGGEQERVALELAVFGTGYQPLPPVTVVLRDTQHGGVKKVTYRPSASVFVRALTDSSMRDLRSLKPLMKPRIPFFLIMPLILGVLGIAVLLLLVLYLVKLIVRRGAEQVDSGQVAQRKLRKLGSNLSAGMPPHECYEELSNIMRSFLESHYRIRALEAVTQEIERDLKKLGVAGFESIMNLLRQADLVKFADIRPDVEESRQSLHKASEVIRSTRYLRPPDQQGEPGDQEQQQ